MRGGYETTSEREQETTRKTAKFSIEVLSDERPEDVEEALASAVARMRGQRSVRVERKW